MNPLAGFRLRWNDDFRAVRPFRTERRIGDELRRGSDSNGQNGDDNREWTHEGSPGLQTACADKLSL